MAKNPLDIEKETNAVLQHQKKLRTEILEINEKIKKIKNSNTKSENILNALIDEKNKKLEKRQKIETFLTKQREREKAFQKDTKTYNKDVENHWDLVKQITDGQNSKLAEKNEKQNRYLKGVGDIVEFKAMENDMAKIGVRFLEEGTVKSERALGIVNESISSRKELSSIYDKIANQSKNVGKNEFQTLDLSETKLDIQKKIEKVESNKNNLGKKRTKILLADLKQQEQFIAGLDKSQQILQKENEILNKSKDSFSGMTDKVFGFVESLPGGDLLSNVFNFDGLKESANDVFGNVMQGNFKDALGSAKDLGGGLANGFKMGEVGAMSMGAKIALATGGVTLLIGGLMKIGKWLLDINQGQADLAKEMGTTIDNAIQIEDAFEEIAYESGDISISTEKIKNTALDLKNELGGVVTTNKEFLTQMTAVKESFGLTTAEATKLDMAATMMGSNMEDFTNEVTAATMEMEKQLGTTIDSRQVMKDLAEIPPGLQASFKGSTAELVMANQKAKMLGMTLKDVEGIGESLLNIEGSLQTEMEARVLTGKNINLDLARQYALTGETGKLQEELLNQAGSLSEFQELNPMAQKKFAEAMGMSKDQMAEMLTKAEQQKKLGFDLNSLTSDQIDAEMKLAKEKGRAMDADMLAAVEKRKEQLRAESLQETMMNIWTKIKDVVAQVVEGPMGGMVNKIKEFLNDGDKIQGLLATIKGIFEGIFDTVGFVWNLFSGLFSIGKSIISGFLSPFIDGWNVLYGAISPIVDMISNMFGDAKEGGKETFSIMDTITTVLKTIGKLVASAITKPLTYIVGIVEFISKLLQGDVSGAFKSLGNMIWDLVMAPIEIVGGMIDEIFGTNIMGFIGTIKDGFLGLFGMITGDGGFGGVMGIIETVGGYVIDFLLAPFNIIKDAVMGILDAVGSLTGAIGKVGEAASAVGDFFGGLFGGDDEEEKAIQGAAAGGVAKKGGLTVVGEMGPEIVKLPGSSEVIPNLDSEGVVNTIQSIVSTLNSLMSLTIDSSDTPDTKTNTPSVSVSSIATDISGVDVKSSVDNTINRNKQTISTDGDTSDGILNQMVEYLQQIANVSSQPVNIQIGNKTIAAMQTNMTMAKNRRIGLDKTYGSTSG